MNKSLLLVVSLAAAMAGCGSHSRDTQPNAAICARLSACGLTFSNAPPGFGFCQDSAKDPLYLDGSGASASKLTAAYRSCVIASSTCDKLRACTHATDVQAALCDTADHDTCSGNTVVMCGIKDRTPGVLATDCAAAGLMCVASADGGATCGMASCDPSNTPPVCDRGLLVGCDSSSHVLNASGCSFGFSCGTDFGGSAACVGETPCDSLTYQERCEGATVVACLRGYVARHDCSTGGPNLTCVLASGYPACGPIPSTQPECSITSDEICRDGVITYCEDAKVVTFDCRSVGLSGCATQLVDTRTAAGCVL